MMPLSKKPRNLSAQERVVSALWDFAAAQEVLDPATAPARRGDGRPPTAVDLAAVRIAMEEIMDAFGYQVIPLQ